VCKWRIKRDKCVQVVLVVTMVLSNGECPSALLQDAIDRDLVGQVGKRPLCTVYLKQNAPESSLQLRRNRFPIALLPRMSGVICSWPRAKGAVVSVLCAYGMVGAMGVSETVPHDALAVKKEREVVRVEGQTSLCY
jgi:hypothetical protein